ncbi:UNVERIFIED_ORG: putative membrane channel-forming protein YqfA (hemolysin III family) [Bacillus sp. B2I3]|nr:putative membrane channel-forming protein YqfA (hemolysin III family) [Bacillus sp. B2I3]
MIKGNSYILVFSMAVLLTIILVSTTPIIIKTLLAFITIAFVFPVIRKSLFKDKFRKIKVAFYSSVTFTIVLFLVSFFEEPSFKLDGDFLIIMVVLFYSLIGNFFYGLPVSLISEFISMSFPIYVSGYLDSYILVSDWLHT